jgi:hypothetical protein
MATIELLRADRYGIPTVVRCAGCGARWCRRPEDHSLWELELFGAVHEHCGDEPELEPGR